MVYAIYTVCEKYIRLHNARITLPENFPGDCQQRCQELGLTTDITNLLTLDWKKNSQRNGFISCDMLIERVTIA